MSRVYLAGPINDLDDDGRGWRTIVESTTDAIEWMNPLDHYQDESDESMADEEIRAMDRSLIDDCDGMLVRYERVAAWGTPREMEYVSDYGRGPDIPVVVWTAHPTDRMSPWATDAPVRDTHVAAVESLQARL